ncbi:MAG: SDR family oxidoreductase [Planctomycetes bacterium]|nr:SDR family oxidoreductase [Planctomycetota bacterium]
MDHSKIDMNALLRGRVAIITGAGSGMGKAAAVLFAHHGAKVLVADVNETTGRAVVDSIVASGGEAAFIKTDVSSAKDADAMCKAAVSRWGTIDVLYNNAAATVLCNEKDRPVHELEEAVWDRMIDICLKGVYLCSKYALPTMMAKGRGSIINVTSIDALLSEPGFDSYTAAKGGIISLTRSMAAEYGKHNIRVNVISPGYIITECQMGWYKNDPAAVTKARSYHAVPRLGEPDDVAYMALYLASDLSGFVTGSIMPVDGGFTASKAGADASEFSRGYMDPGEIADKT